MALGKYRIRSRFSIIACAPERKGGTSLEHDGAIFRMHRNNRQLAQRMPTPTASAGHMAETYLRALGSRHGRSIGKHGGMYVPILEQGRRQAWIGGGRNKELDPSPLHVFQQMRLRAEKHWPRFRRPAIGSIAISRRCPGRRREWDELPPRRLRPRIDIDHEQTRSCT